MATYKTGINGAMYVDGVLINFITDLELSMDRDVAESAPMGQESKIKRVGAYGGEFSGSALVDMDSKQIFDEVIAVSTSTCVVSIYPDRTDLTDGWYFDAQFSSWSAGASSGDFWAGDFGGVVSGDINTLGFS